MPDESHPPVPRRRKADHEPAHAVDLLGIAREQGVHAARITALELGHSEIRAALAGQSDHLTRQDGAMGEMRTQVQALNTKVTAGFEATTERLDTVVPKIVYVEGLMVQDTRQRLRRVAWREAITVIADKLQYVFGAIFITIAGYAFTHPVRGHVDPELVPYWVLVTILLVLSVAWSAYDRIRHRESPETPEMPDLPEGREHKELHP